MYLVFQNPFLNKNYIMMSKRHGLHVVKLNETTLFFHSYPSGYSGVVADGKWYLYFNHQNKENICKRPYVLGKEMLLGNTTRELCIIDKYMLLRHFPTKTHQFYKASDHITESEIVDSLKALV